MPLVSQVGLPRWTDAALDALNGIQRMVAYSEVCVRKRLGSFEIRSLGLGRPLIVEGNRALRKDAFILARVFEIVGVNGLRIAPVVNEGSARIQERIGAEMIGTLRERIQRSDDCSIDVSWRLYLSSVAQVLAREAGCVHTRPDERGGRNVSEVAARG